MRFHYIALMLIFMSTPAWACGENTPAQLKERALGKFKAWDLNKNKLFEPEEFLAADGNFISRDTDNQEWASLYEEKLAAYDEFLKADADYSGALTFEEWLAVRPPEQFMMNRSGC